MQHVGKLYGNRLGERGPNFEVTEGPGERDKKGDGANRNFKSTARFRAFLFSILCIDFIKESRILMLYRLCWLSSLLFLIGLALQCLPVDGDADFESVRVRMTKDFSGRRGDPVGKYWRESGIPTMHTKSSA